MCSRCCMVPYCSKECQRYDWKYHKSVCHPDVSERLRGLFKGMRSQFILYPRSASSGMQFHNLPGRNVWFIRSPCGESYVTSNPLDVRPRCLVCFRSFTSESVNDTSVCLTISDADQMYNRCDDCLQAQYELCLVSFQPVHQCVKRRDQLFLDKFWSLWIHWGENLNGDLRLLLFQWFCLLYTENECCSLVDGVSRGLVTELDTNDNRDDFLYMINECGAVTPMVL